MCCLLAEKEIAQKVHKSLVAGPILFLLYAFGVICGTFSLCYGISLLRTRSLHQNVSTTSAHHSVWQTRANVPHCNSSLYDDADAAPANTSTRACVYRYHQMGTTVNSHLVPSSYRSHSGVPCTSIDPPPRLHRLLSYKSTDDNDVPPPSYREATEYSTLPALDSPSPCTEANYISSLSTNAIDLQVATSTASQR